MRISFIGYKRQIDWGHDDEGVLFMTKALSALLDVSLLFIASPTVYASAPSTPNASNEGHTVIYPNPMSEEELFAEHMRRIFGQPGAMSGKNGAVV